MASQPDDSRPGRPGPGDGDGIATDVSQVPPYKMDHTHRGICLILNWNTCGREEPRSGTEADVDRVNDVFGRKFGFRVYTEHDLSVDDTRRTLDEWSRYSIHADADCFVCFVMTHGREGVLTGSDGQQFTYEDLYEPFLGDKCPALSGKPKIFFIQACMGAKRDCMVADDAAGGIGGGQHHLPRHSDILISFATWWGFRSYRNTGTGTWYIQTLCDVLESSSGGIDLVRLLTHVNWMVAKRTIRDDKATIKQMPSFLSSLRKSIYFTPKAPSPRAGSPGEENRNREKRRRLDVAVVTAGMSSGVTTDGTLPPASQYHWDPLLSLSCEARFLLSLEDRLKSLTPQDKCTAQKEMLEALARAQFHTQ